LLIAYACRPGESSEREVGWKWSNLISQDHKVTVLTRETNRVFIEENVSDILISNNQLNFIYYDLPQWLRRFKKGEKGLYLYYTLWTFFATLKSRKLNKYYEWDLTHFLTFGTLLWPQFGFLTNSKKYILGPVGGGEKVPLSLLKSFSIKGKVIILLRACVQGLLIFNPLYLANLIRADLIFARTKDTVDLIPKIFHKKVELLLETATDHNIEKSAKNFDLSKDLEIISVGRLIPSKFNRLFLDVLYDFKKECRRSFKVKVIGSGPELDYLRLIRDNLNLTEVEFVGLQSSKYVTDSLRSSDIYFSTTMKEAGTWAFFEAITCDVPIVCLKLNGPDMIVGDGCGLKTKPASYKKTKELLKNNLLLLAESEPMRVDLAVKAKLYLKNNLSWKEVRARINNSYQNVIKS
jgi:glycosyltransferase involved in cell wall biosynthesis